MSAPSAMQLVEAWDHGCGRPPTERALLLVCAACPEEAPDVLAALPIGRRNAWLLYLRQQTLGPVLACEGTCPACGEHLEFDIAADDLLAGAPGDVPAHLSLTHKDEMINFRLPDSTDLSFVAATHGGVTALLDRCLLKGPPASTLPADVVASAAARMAEADPLADIRLALDCPACRHTWSEPFDVAAYVWEEMDEWVRRLLWEVHRLASAYGWPERDVLAMGARRRQYYLHLTAS